MPRWLERHAHAPRTTIVIVIFNPAAGKRRTQRLWRVLDVLVTNGMRLKMVETSHAGHATDLARDAVADGASLVVAAGGDGTIAEVARGLDGSGARLGIIPLGTANVLAHELALPSTANALAAALAFGRTRTLWPGIAVGPEGERMFVQMLSVGLDAQVVHRMPRLLKRTIGRGAYTLQTLRELFRYDFKPLHLRIDQTESEAATVIVTKGRFYGGRHLLAPDADACVRGFSVVAFRRGGIGPTLLYGAALPFDLLPRSPWLQIGRASRVDILGNHSVPAQADGDPNGTTPLSIRDAARPIEVVVG